MKKTDTTAPEPAEPAGKKRGRPPIITLELIEQVARLIAKGMTEEQACCLVGVKYESFRSAWHRNAEFATAHKKAQAAFLDESLDIIARGQRGWQGRAWILERRHGPQFRRNLTVDLQQKPVTEMTDEELKEALLGHCDLQGLQSVESCGADEQSN